jgi:hypothetical protein
MPTFAGVVVTANTFFDAQDNASGNAVKARLGSGGLHFRSDKTVVWSVNTNSSTADTGISRIAAATIAVGNATTGSFVGSVKLTNIESVGTVELSTAGNGIILKSPDGTRYRVTVANGGTLAVTAV